VCFPFVYILSLVVLKAESWNPHSLGKIQMVK